MNSQDELLELIRRYFDATATEEDRDHLQTKLKQSPAARRIFARYANIDSALGSRRIELTGPAERSERVAQFPWRPLSGVAAGIVIGLLSASLVYGFMAQDRLRVDTLLSEGFEDPAMVREQGLPKRAGVWSGDFLAPQEAKGEVKPAEGRRMVVLPPVEKRKFSYASRFLDVSTFPASGAKQTCRLEVTAQFHGATPGVLDRFQIRLAAFAENVPGARAIWASGFVDEQALLHVAKTVTTDPGTHGWTTLRAAIDLPANAKVVLVSLAAGGADPEAPKTDHYLDDVKIHLITREAPLTRQ